MGRLRDLEIEYKAYLTLHSISPQNLLISSISGL
jgi:hypothetical protein